MWASVDRRVALFKFIDHWLGGLLCFFLAFFHRATRPFYRTYTAAAFRRPPRAIWVMKFFGLGSIVLAAPMVQGIRAKYPGAKLTFLTFQENVDLARRLDLGDEIRAIETANPFKLAASIFSTLIAFSLRKPDVVVDLEFYSKFGTLMSYFSGAPWRLGFYLPLFWRNSLVNVPISFNHSRHILDMYRMAGEALGVIEAPVRRVDIPLGEDERNAVRRILHERAVGERDILLGVNVNASFVMDCRKWPLENFGALINRLLKTAGGIKVILTGTRKEAAYTASLFQHIDESLRPRVINLAGALSFGEFIALLKELKLMLTNDSGPFHLAKAQGTPTVSIWGPGNPGLYGPYGDEDKTHRVLYKRWPCSPCLYLYRTDAGRFCEKTVPCLKAIGVEEVLEAVRAGLAS